MTYLYHPRLVGVITFVGLTCLVLGQTRLIYDATGLFHQTWHPAWRWTLSAGFELVILGSALAFSVTQDRRLRWGEIFTIAVSIGAGVVVGMTGHALDDYARWAVVVALGVVPVQYAVAVRAGHSLTTAFYRTGQGAADATGPGRTSPSVVSGVTPVLSTPPAPVLSSPATVVLSDVQVPCVALSNVQMSDDPDNGRSPDDIVYVYARLVEEGLTHAQIADRLEVTPRTVSRYRERAERAGLRPVRGARVNTNGTGVVAGVGTT